MADEYTIVKIPNDASDEDAIKIINDNFSKITKRIKEQNINISFLDLLRLDTIWTGTYATDGTGSYNNAAMENRRNNFISTCWNTLANYSGVYIQYTATSTDVAAFIVPGAVNEYVENGDFLVKLPGAQFLHIEGQEQSPYIPTSYDPVAGTIEYSTSGTVVSTLPTYVSTGLQVTITPVSSHSAAQISGMTSANVRSTRWFTQQSPVEEVLWAGSYCSINNITDLPLVCQATFKP